MFKEMIEMNIKILFKNIFVTLQLNQNVEQEKQNS